MERIIYICEVCLGVSEDEEQHHGRPMVRIDCGPPGSPRCQPIMDGEGNPKTHAPRWWVEHVLKEERQG